MTSRAGQSDNQGANLPERDNADHDAAPAARASKPEASAADSALPDAGTGDTPESHATPGEGTSQGGCTLTDAEREAIAFMLRHAAVAAERDK